MSLILDALRRARHGAPPTRPDGAAPPAFQAPVPAALRFGAAGLRERSGRGRRIALTVVAIAVVLGIATWGVLTFRPDAAIALGIAGFGSRTPAHVPPNAGSASRTPAYVPSDAGSASRTPAYVPPDDVRRAGSGEAGPASQLASGQAADAVVAPLPPPSESLKPQAPPDHPITKAPQEQGIAGARSHVAAPSGPRPFPATPPAALTTAAINTTPATPVVDHFALAVRYQSLGNFEQALRHYTAALEADEFNVEARNNLGLLYREHGLLNDAIDQFRRAVSINPQYLKARSNLAVALTDAGRLAEANAELRAALAIEPRNVDLLVNLALVQKADHMPDAAQETLVRALGYNPKHAVAHYNLALLYEEKGERAAAYDHYLAFLENADPALGGLLSDVRRRADALRKQLDVARQ